MQLYSLTEEIAIQRFRVTREYIDLEMEFDEEMPISRQRNTVRFIDEVDIAKELIDTVEEEQENLSQLTPNIELIHQHWKKLHEGAHTPNPAGLEFFPTKKFNDDLKFQGMLQKELRKSLSSMEKENKEILEGLKNEKKRACIQDEKLDKIRRKTSKYEFVFKETKKEIEKYKKMLEELKELLKEREKTREKKLRKFEQSKC